MNKCQLSSFAVKEYSVRIFWILNFRATGIFVFGFYGDGLPLKCGHSRVCRIEVKKKSVSILFFSPGVDF